MAIVRRGFGGKVMINRMRSPPMIRHDAQRSIAGAATVVLLLVATLYAGRGFWVLTRDPVQAKDLQQRWRDQHYVFKGQNPYDVLFEQGGFGDVTTATAGRDVRVDPHLGPPLAGGYPPWAFFTGAPLFWPDWPAVRWYWAGINALAIALVGTWITTFVGPSDRRVRSLQLAGWLGVSSICTTLGVGQIGVVIVALLAGILWAERRDRWFVAGLLLGVAMFKPTLTIPFALALLVCGRWRSVAVGVGYCLLASAAVWYQTDTDPLEMTHQMLRAGRLYTEAGAGFVTIAGLAGLSASAALAGVAAVSLAAGGLLLLRFRRESLLLNFAIASVIARVWTYHQLYDNLILIFLWLAVCLQWTDALKQRRDDRQAATRLAMMAIVGLSLWLPAKCIDFTSAMLIQHAIWIGALLFLLRDPPAMTPRSMLVTTEGPQAITAER